MSRIGKLPIVLPQDVSVKVDNLNIEIQGPKGTINKSFKGQVDIVVQDKNIIVKPHDKVKSKAMWGTIRSIINSMVIGVKEGYTRELEVIGVGYRVSVKNSFINLALGKSHNTKIEIPKEITIETPKQNLIILHSFNKEILGSFVSRIKQERPPEPYKGKGIKLKGEYIQRKEGKKG